MIVSGVFWWKWELWWRGLEWMSDVVLVCSHEWTKIIEYWLMSSRQLRNIIININSFTWLSLEKVTFGTITLFIYSYLEPLQPSIPDMVACVIRFLQMKGWQRAQQFQGDVAMTLSFIWTPWKLSGTIRTCGVTKLCEQQSLNISERPN